MDLITLSMKILYGSHHTFHEDPLWISPHFPWGCFVDLTRLSIRILCGSVCKHDKRHWSNKNRWSGYLCRLTWGLFVDLTKACPRIICAFFPRLLRGSFVSFSETRLMKCEC